MSEYLFAPWKILALLFPSAPAPVAAGTAATAATAVVHHAGICGYEDVGGQVLNICNVGGYVMPAFVFWASVMILLLFFAASSGLLSQCARVAASLSWLAAQIEKTPATLRDLTALRAIMQKQPISEHSWKLFEETLLISAQGDEVYSTVPVESIFSKAALIEENIHSAVYNAVPGILTGLGLLMTFVAILDGLSHVTVSANMDVQGIGGLINGLSGKFVSSITAVTCAVAFVFVERLAYAQPNHGYRKLISLLTTRFKRRTAEHILYHIQSQLITQGALQREFASTLTQIQKDMSPPAERSHRSS